MQNYHVLIFWQYKNNIAIFDYLAISDHWYIWQLQDK